MDSELVERAQQGDREAFGLLAVPLGDRLFAIACRILRDDDLASDATQQALVSIWRDLPQLRDLARFDAWSYRVLVRACYAERRRERRWSPSLHVLPSALVGDAAVDGTSFVIDRDQLERAARRLSIDHRAVVVLRYYLDLPHAEIAEVLGIPVGTVRSRVRYALQGFARRARGRRPASTIGGAVMKTDHDLERAVRLWVAQGSDQLPDSALDAALDRIETTKQRHAGWLARRIHLMNGNVLKLGLAAAAIFAVAILGLRFLPSTVGGPPDSTPTPVPTPETLASGSVAGNLGEFGTTFDFDATRTGDDVSGTIVVSNPQGGQGAYTVDVQCTRTTDNLLLIGGEVTDSTYELIADGAYVVMALVPGTPARMLAAADVLASDEVPAPADSCEAYIDTLLSDPGFAQGVNDHGAPINGELDLGS